MAKRIMDKVNCAIINLTDRTSIPQLVEVIADDRCVIYCDTGAMDLASALGTDLVALFGSTDLRRTGPFRGKMIQKKELPCVPCNRRKCDNPQCIKASKPQDVLHELESLL